MATICPLRKPPALRHVEHTTHLQRLGLPGFLQALDVLTTIVDSRNVSMIQKWEFCRLTYFSFASTLYILKDPTTSYEDHYSGPSVQLLQLY
jgi:hypothetical protein